MFYSSINQFKIKESNYNDIFDSSFSINGNWSFNRQMGRIQWKCLLTPRVYSLNWTKCLECPKVSLLVIVEEIDKPTFSLCVLSSFPFLWKRHMAYFFSIDATFDRDINFPLMVCVHAFLDYILTRKVGFSTRVLWKWHELETYIDMAL